MMKRLAVAVITFIMLSVASVQASESFAFVENLRTFSAGFEQENHYAGLESFSFFGNVYIEFGYKALWDYEEPDEFYLLEPGKILYYSDELRQALNYRIDDYTDDTASLLLGVLLDGAVMTDRFTATENGSIVTLVPKRNIGIAAVVVEIVNDVPVRLYSEDTEGNTIDITFKNIKVNASIDRKVFEVTLPPGTDYIER